jgi:hypothetical protein
MLDAKPTKPKAAAKQETNNAVAGKSILLPNDIEHEVIRRDLEYAQAPTAEDMKPRVAANTEAACFYDVRCGRHRPNENKMSHHWRGRAWQRDVELESWKSWAYAGQWLAPSSLG